MANFMHGDPSPLELQPRGCTTFVMNQHQVLEAGPYQPDECPAHFLITQEHVHHIFQLFSCDKALSCVKTGPCLLTWHS